MWQKCPNIFGACIYTKYPIKSAVFMALPQKHLLALAGWVSCTQPPDRILSADAAAHPSAPLCCIKSPPKRNDRPEAMKEPIK